MDVIKKSKDELRIIALDYRRIAGQIDDAVKHMEQVNKKNKNEDVNQRILESCNLRKEQDKVCSAVKLGKKERRLWKQLKNTVKTET